MRSAHELGLCEAAGITADQKIDSLRSKLFWCFARQWRPPSCSKITSGGRGPVCELAIERLLFFDLRRSGVRCLIKAGVSERVARKVMYHLSRTVFETYNIVDDRDEVERLQKPEEAQNL